MWINNKDKWQKEEKDRYFVFRNYENSGYKYNKNSNVDNINDIQNLGENVYKIKVQPLNQPGVFKTLRVEQHIIN